MNIIFCSKHNDSSSIDPQIVNTIKAVLDDVNHFVKQYRVASTLIQTCNMFDFKLYVVICLEKVNFYKIHPNFNLISQNINPKGYTNGNMGFPYPYFSLISN